MEIKIDIPQNDYVVPTEVREFVVQAICDTFLKDNVWSTFHPVSDGAYRAKTLYLTKNKSTGKYGGFSCKRYDDVEYLRFNGAEMETAFQALRCAGYHIFRVYQYGSWMGYRCSKKPYMDGGTEVFEFTDFID